MKGNLFEFVNWQKQLKSVSSVLLSSLVILNGSNTLNATKGGDATSKVGRYRTEIGEPTDAHSRGRQDSDTEMKGKDNVSEEKVESEGSASKQPVRVSKIQKFRAQFEVQAIIDQEEKKVEEAMKRAAEARKRSIEAKQKAAEAKRAVKAAKKAAEKAAAAEAERAEEDAKRAEKEAKKAAEEERRVKEEAKKAEEEAKRAAEAKKAAAEEAERAAEAKKAEAEVEAKKAEEEAKKEEKAEEEAKKEEKAEEEAKKEAKRKKKAEKEERKAKKEAKRKKKAEKEARKAKREEEKAAAKKEEEEAKIAEEEAKKEEKVAEEVEKKVADEPAVVEPSGIDEGACEKVERKRSLSIAQRVSGVAKPFGIPRIVFDICGDVRQKTIDKKTHNQELIRYIESIFRNADFIAQAGKSGKESQFKSLFASLKMTNMEFEKLLPYIYNKDWNAESAENLAIFKDAIAKINQHRHLSDRTFEKVFDFINKEVEQNESINAALRKILMPANSEIQKIELSDFAALAPEDGVTLLGKSRYEECDGPATLDARIKIAFKIAGWFKGEIAKIECEIESYSDEELRAFCEKIGACFDSDADRKKLLRGVKVKLEELSKDIYRDGVIMQMAVANFARSTPLMGDSTRKNTRAATKKRIDEFVSAIEKVAVYVKDESDRKSLLEDVKRIEGMSLPVVKSSVVTPNIIMLKDGLKEYCEFLGELYEMFMRAEIYCNGLCPSAVQYKNVLLKRLIDIIRELNTKVQNLETTEEVKRLGEWEDLGEVLFELSSIVPEGEDTLDYLSKNIKYLEAMFMQLFTRLEMGFKTIIDDMDKLEEKLREEKIAPQEKVVIKPEIKKMQEAKLRELCDALRFYEGKDELMKKCEEYSEFRLLIAAILGLKNESRIFTNVDNLLRYLSDVDDLDKIVEKKEVMKGYYEDFKRLSTKMQNLKDQSSDSSIKFLSWVDLYGAKNKCSE